MLNRLFLGDLEGPAPTATAGYAEMRAYFAEKLLELARLATAEVNYEDAGDTVNATVKVSVPDEVYEYMRTLFEVCLTVRQMQQIVEVIEVYGQQAMDETSKIDAREHTSLEEDTAEQCIITVSVSLSLTIKQLLTEAMAEQPDEERQDDGGVHEDVRYSRDGEVLEDWQQDPYFWNPDAAHPDEDYENEEEDWTPDDVVELSESEKELIILLEAENMMVDMEAITTQSNELEASFDEIMDDEIPNEMTPKYHVALRTIMNIVNRRCSGTINLIVLMDIFLEPEIIAELSPLTDDERDYCIVTIFNAVAEEALIQVEAFSSMLDAKVNAGEEGNDDIDTLLFSYVDKLKVRHGLT